MTLLFNETFQGTGYSETWSEGETLTAGNGADEDFSSAVYMAQDRIRSWGSQCFRTFALPLKTSAKVIDHGIGAEAITYSRVEVVVVTDGLANGEETVFYKAMNAGNDPLFELKLKQTAGVVSFVLDSYHDNASNEYTSILPVALLTLYRVEIKWDATANVWDWRINGVAQKNDQDSTDPVTAEGDLTGGHPTEMSKIELGLEGFGSDAINVLYNNFAIDDSAYLGEGALYITPRGGDNTGRK